MQTSDETANDGDVNTDDSPFDERVLKQENEAFDSSQDISRGTPFNNGAQTTSVARRESASKVNANFSAVCCLIKTDDERYKIMITKWMNIAVPNPNLDLTTHNYLIKWQKKGPHGVNRHGKRRIASENNEILYRSV